MSSHDKNILIIDRDREMRYFLQQALTAAGHCVREVDRSADGLRELLSGSYDLAMIEMLMPEISGPNICRALRQHEKTRGLPVVMLSDAILDRERIAAEKNSYGANDFLFKPITGNSLQQMLGKVFSKAQVEVAETATAAKKAQSLDEFSLPMLLHRFYVERATGLLHLHQRAAKKIVYIKEGYPVFVRSNVLAECLGRMLVREGVITEVECDESVERSRQSGRLQGTELIEMGLLTPEALQQSLVRQITEKLLATFAWTSGSWQFVPAADFKRNVTQIRLSPANLILQGIERFWNSGQLERFLSPCRNDYLRPTADPKYRFQDISLSERGKGLLRQCQGDKTLEEIVDAHPLTRREVQRIFCALLISDLLERSSVAEQVKVDDLAYESEPKHVDPKLRAKILEDYRRIVGADFFTALGLERDCRTNEVRRAYYRLAKEYHPDRFIGLGLSQEMHNKINEIFQYVSEAYNVLSDEEEHVQYLNSLQRGPEKDIDIKQVIEAEGAYQEGLAFIKIRRYADAVRVLKHALELSPEEPEYMASYAWALYKRDPEDQFVLQQAMEVLLAARELRPDHDKLHLYLGYVYLGQHKERQAERAFEIALQADPGCVEALRELRLINLRRENAAQQQKGFLSKFRKKD